MCVCEGGGFQKIKVQIDDAFNVSIKGKSTLLFKTLLNLFNESPRGIFDSRYNLDYRLASSAQVGANLHSY